MATHHLPSGEPAPEVTGAARGRARELALLTALVAALTLPFANQAIHIDDEVYLRLADELLAAPGEYFTRPGALFGRLQPLVLHSQHPPLTVAYLALARAAGATSEVALHGWYALWALVAATGAYAFFRRFTTAPLAASALLVLTPAFVVSSHTLMTDVPFLGLFLWALTLSVRTVDSGRGGAAAAVLATLAAFTQYRGLAAPCLALLYAWRMGRLDRRIVVAMAAPVAALATYEVGVWLAWGVAPFAESVGFVSLAPGRVAFSAAVYLAGLGACTLFLLPPDRLRLGAVALALATAAAIVTVYRREAPPVDLVVAWVLLAAGLLALAGPAGHVARLTRGLGRDANELRKSDDELLAGAAAILLASLLAFSLFACVRNLLVVLPFVVALLIREGAPHWTRGRLLVAGGLTGALALACAASDYAWAESYRRLPGRFATAAGAGELWFAGEWGFRHYLREAGGHYLLETDDDLPAGATLLVPELASPENAIAPALAARLELVETIEIDNPTPLVLMSERRRNCGWYAEGFGLLPFCVSGPVQERISHYRVVP